MKKGINQYSFEPGAMSIIQMGEELIGHPSTAINELVKNGYDADATSVYVFIHLVDKKNFIAIFDNGLGMENTTLFGDWLKPSVSSKRALDVKSEVFGRSFLGSKGIGRLASMALGKFVTVISKKNNELDYNWLTIDSSLFKTEKLLKDVRFPGGIVTNYEDLFIQKEYLKFRNRNSNQDLLNFLKNDKISKFNEGTLILIEDVDDSVKSIFEDEFKKDENDLSIHDTSIYRSLSVLVTPLKLNNVIQKELLSKKIIDTKQSLATEDNTFNIYYGSNILPITIPKVKFILVRSTSIIDVFDYRVIGKVTKDGDVFGKFRCQRLEGKEYDEDFVIKKESSLKSKLDNKKRNIKELTPTEMSAEVGEFYFDIRVYDRGEEDSKEKLYNKIPANTNEQKKKQLDNILGLRISKNGFGVKPYGEESKDWLDLSQIRVQNPGQNVSINQILGYVFFYSPQNDGLKEKTNREGFYLNRAFIDAKNILQLIFKNLGQLRYNFRLQHNLGRIPTNRLKRPDADSFLDFMKSKSDQEDLLKRSEEFAKEVTTALDNMEDTLSFSQRLASLGTGLELVYHELGQPISKIGGSRAIMNRKIPKIENEEVRNVLITEISQIGSYTAQLDQLKGSLKPAIGKSIPVIFKPQHTFKKVCHLFKKDFIDENIELLFQNNSEHFEIEDTEYPLWISFLNIVNNAVYWLKLNEKKEKQISFSIEYNSIVVSNNGPFIQEEILDLIFEYGYSLKKEKSATGLGLAFTKNILQLNKWSVSAENRTNGPAFIITKNNS